MRCAPVQGHYPLYSLPRSFASLVGLNRCALLSDALDVSFSSCDTFESPLHLYYETGLQNFPASLSRLTA